MIHWMRNKVCCPNPYLYNPYATHTMNSVSVQVTDSKMVDSGWQLQLDCDFWELRRADMLLCAEAECGSSEQAKLSGSLVVGSAPPSSV